MGVLRLEVGKPYMNSIGHPVKIIKESVGFSLFIGDNDFEYEIDGCVWLGRRRMEDHKQCLIVEVVDELPELVNILNKLKPHTNQWCKELQADIYMLPHGYLVRDYDIDTAKFIGSCFVPNDIK